MASLNCPGCGELLPKDGAPCSTCGFKKIPGFTRKLVTFVAIFVVLGTLWLLFLTKGEWGS